MQCKFNRLVSLDIADNAAIGYLELQEVGALVRALGEVHEFQLVVNYIELLQSGEDPLRAGGVRSAVDDDRHGAELLSYKAEMYDRARRNRELQSVTLL